MIRKTGLKPLTHRRGNSSKMNFWMVSSVSYLKVFYSVICLVAIYVMYNFVTSQVASNFFLHYKAVFVHISSSGNSWMFRAIYQNIPHRVLDATALPVIVLLTSVFFSAYFRSLSYVLDMRLREFHTHSSLARVNPITLQGAKFSGFPILVTPVRFLREKFATNQTSF